MRGGRTLSRLSALRPEVFLKAVALARNTGRSLEGLTTVNHRGIPFDVETASRYRDLAEKAAQSHVVLSVRRRPTPSTGCTSCRKPSYRILGSSANASGAILTAFMYSDLLLHDMGADLADGFEQGSATGSEFRTAPLWRVSDRQHFLHDGRASSILEAILAHGGQASSAVAAFNALSKADQNALLDFLNGI
ncbi:MAG TPA: di-heme oxidoredictase family protein [Vicinamibacterales bacterium]|nr:di-heme oxidoredictase family protein [Vicinamibacterales bacterium]